MALMKGAKPGDPTSLAVTCIVQIRRENYSCKNKIAAFKK
jgi:hypothetical protein